MININVVYENHELKIVNVKMWKTSGMLEWARGVWVLRPGVIDKSFSGRALSGLECVSMVKLTCLSSRRHTHPVDNNFWWQN